MTDRLQESVSALMDGEASELEVRRVLARVESPEVRESWRAWQLTRGALAGDSLQFAQIDLSARIRASLEDEDPQVEPTTPPPSSHRTAWQRPLGGLAVAATVAVAVVMGGQWLRTPDGVEAVDQTAHGRVYPGPMVTTPAASSEAVGGEFQGLAPAAAMDPDREAELQLEQLLLQHSERTVIGVDGSTMPYARLPAGTQHLEEQQ